MLIPFPWNRSSTANATSPTPSGGVINFTAQIVGGQNWVGSPSAILVDGEIYLAYRLREVDRRGYAVQVARSADGVHFLAGPYVILAATAQASPSPRRNLRTG